MSMKNCVECGTKMEIHIEINQYEDQGGILCWYCPTCKAGCGYLTDKEKQCEDCGLEHFGQSCFDAEKEQGKRCNL